ncbi:hypothetical protein CJ430_32015, partial [Klebsiella pneumoniae]
MALFSPYDVERLYGNLADCAIGDLYPQLVADGAQMALFSPYDVERLYGNLADCAIGDLYPQLVA